MKRICLSCTKEFTTYPSRVNAGLGKFCSRGCRNTYHSSGEKNYFYGKSFSKKGKDSFNWKGGRKILRGYVMVLMPKHPSAKSDGYIAEHRLVMEKKLGRYLLPTEVVHHMNHVKTDNREENLMLIKNKSEHMKEHKDNLVKARKARWGK